MLYRSELTRHPLDIRGSRRSLEAARIFLAMAKDKKEAEYGEKVDFLDNTIVKEKEAGSKQQATGTDNMIT